MHKLRLLPMLLCAGLAAQAQQNPATDTTRRGNDSLLNQSKQDVLDNIPTISLDENDQGDAGTQNISSILTAGRDPYFNAASFNFSAVRFRLRGYENDQFSTYMNGVPMDNLDNGFAPYGLWGGLNDVMRSRDVEYGLHYTTFAFGDFGSNTNIDVRASKQRAQTSVNYANANRNYTHRVMLTHGTGLSRRGWAFIGSLSARWAEEGYVPGTWYKSLSWFAGIDKRVNEKHLLSLVAFGAPTENGRQGAATQEAQDLAGDPYYNPNWGYQNGKKRNASVGKTNQPVLVLTHDFRIKNNVSLLTGVGYSFGERSITALDWYNAPDPRPDYYRNLPSYLERFSSVIDPEQAKRVREAWMTDVNVRQINWQKLYDANRASMMTINNADGVNGKTVSGLRSRYVVQDRIIGTQRLNLNTTLNARVNDHLDITGGLTFQNQKNHYYQKVNDLLGGDFYMDLNQFAERDFPTDPSANQNDLNNPNRIVRVGDRYGYNYNIDLTQATAWAQGVFKFNKVDLFAAGQYGYTSFQREGFVRSGLFPNDSYGKGIKNEFNPYAVKGGVTYKFNGRNYVYANAGYQERAPYFDNVYVSPRTRNTQQANVQMEEIKTFEGAYIHTAPKLKLRIGGFYTHMDKQVDVMSYFDDVLGNFVNLAMSGVSRQLFGAELGAEYNIGYGVTVNAAAAVGRYYYDSNPNATITADNNAQVLAARQIYLKNFRLPTPQEAYSLGVTYRSPKFWFASLTGNYFRESYLSVNPMRRTWEALKNAPAGSADYDRIFDQTRFDQQYTVDFFFGWTKRLGRAYNIGGKPTTFVFNIGVSNLTNNRSMITGGYEQLRFDGTAGVDGTANIDKFPPKLFYAYGINYFTSVGLRF
ncbi:TonB-dependent receptor [Flaviaesturariibacter flavus]|uniref:TonB-dependent receptor n=1 Tax=Flaviaesturariibacter flavus TaxID=2502780 RepID=A0A4R1BK86_9BACT|nr:TonB-dependent receptor [Flaviaesturariibacter flavus]TCJ17753.1 TonB-dependent receptor [Flaviaesturariibacter flavus]